MTIQKIPPRVLVELEQRGIDSVRALLITMSDGRSGTGRGASLNLGGGIEVSREHMETWLRSKERIAARWIKIGAIAAVAAAILAGFAWLLPIK